MGKTFRAAALFILGAFLFGVGLSGQDNPTTDTEAATVSNVPVKLSDPDAQSLARFTANISRAGEEIEVLKLKFDAARAQLNEARQAQLTLQAQYQTHLVLKAVSYKVDPAKFSYDPKRQSFIPLADKVSAK